MEHQLIRCIYESFLQSLKGFWLPAQGAFTASVISENSQWKSLPRRADLHQKSAWNTGTGLVTFDRTSCQLFYFAADCWCEEKRTLCEAQLLWQLTPCKHKASTPAVLLHHLCHGENMCLTLCLQQQLLRHRLDALHLCTLTSLCHTHTQIISCFTVSVFWGFFTFFSYFYYFQSLIL